MSTTPNELTNLAVPYAIHFTKIGKPLKEVDPNIIVTWGKPTKATGEWLKALYEALVPHSGWLFSLVDSYLDGNILTMSSEPITDVTVYCHTLNITSYTIRVQAGKGHVRVHFKKTKNEPLAELQNKLITVNAGLFTWPDTKGKIKLFLHKGSKVARTKYKQPHATSYLNAGNVSKSTRWHLLGEYIRDCELTGTPPIRKDICSLVRTISEYEVNKEQTKELTKLGMMEGSTDAVL